MALLPSLSPSHDSGDLGASQPVPQVLGLGPQLLQYYPKEAKKSGSWLGSYIPTTTLLSWGSLDSWWTTRQGLSEKEKNTYKDKGIKIKTR